MKLSIVIPVYNVEAYIEQCLLSVLNQSDLNDTEIILVDDCGTDNSMEIAQKIVKEYSNSYNIKLVSHTQNQGLSAARNTGIIYAKGDYVFFLDSDDELPENTIRTFYHYLNKYENIDFFVGNYIINGPFNGTILNNKKIEYDNNNEIFNAYIENQWYVMACGKFINRNFLISNSLLFPIKRLHEDEYFSFKLALYAKTMVVINENVYIYKIRNNSITTYKKRKNYVDSFWNIEQRLQLIKDLQLQMSKPMYNYITSNLWWLSIFVLRSRLKDKEKVILVTWCKNALINIKQKKYTIKSFVKTLLLAIYPSIVLLVFNLFLYKRIKN